MTLGPWVEAQSWLFTWVCRGTAARPHSWLSHEFYLRPLKNAIPRRVQETEPVRGPWLNYLKGCLVQPLPFRARESEARVGR